MNEEQLIEFVNWLPTAVPEFQNASPDQIVQSLNQMAESEEGQQMISQLVTAFQESKQAGNSQMFKKGGKMAAFVNKYGNGGCVSCKKKEILRGGMVNKMAEKMQDGGDAPKISRRDAIRAGMSNKGYTREQANIALANAMNTGRDIGLRGRELRQWARRIFIPNAPEVDLNVEVPNAPELEQVPIGKFVFDNNSINPTIDTIPQTFNQAFRGARKAGLDEFTWNGKRYNTLLKEEAAALPTPDARYSGYTYKDMFSGQFPHNFVQYWEDGGKNDNVSQEDLSLEPEVKPRGIRGWFWDPTFFPRVDTGAEIGENWTGERATYYKPNGNLIQILTRKFPAGNTSETIRTIRHPFTPQADTTTIVRNSSSEDQRRVANDKFNGVFSLNFDKKNK